MESNFRVMYRWEVDEGKDKDFLENWKNLTQEFKKDYGALGSCIHRADDGTYVAYAMWPNRDTWASFRADRVGKPGNTYSRMIQDPLPLEVVIDLLQEES